MLGACGASQWGFSGVKKDNFSMKNHLFSPLKTPLVEPPKVARLMGVRGQKISFSAGK